jgi:hypothetical protein
MMLSRRRATLAAIIAFSALSGSCGAPAETPTPETNEPIGITLPPAWTATATATVLPPTGTPTPTSIPKELPREIVGTLGTPLPTVIVQVSAPDTMDRTGWKRVEVKSAYLLLPANYEVVDMGPMGEAMVELMEVFAKGMVEAFSGLVTPEADASPTPPFEELQDFSIDLVMAADPTGESAVFLVGEPRLEEADVQSMLVKAVDDIKGKTEVLSTELIEGHTYPMGRAIVRVRDAETGKISQQALYVMLHGPRAWTLSCQSLTRDFENLLPVFDSVARSLTPKS